MLAFANIYPPFIFFSYKFSSLYDTTFLCFWQYFIAKIKKIMLILITAHDYFYKKHIFIYFEVACGDRFRKCYELCELHFLKWGKRKKYINICFFQYNFPWL